MMPKRDTLTQNQLSYIEARLKCQSVKEAAGTVGVSLRTARRWEASPHVQQALRDARNAALDKATARASMLLDDALAGLSSIAEDTTTPPGVRVTAWRSILDASLKLIEVNDLAARLAALESRFATTTQHNVGD